MPGSMVMVWPIFVDVRLSIVAFPSTVLTVTALAALRSSVPVLL